VYLLTLPSALDPNSFGWAFGTVGHNEQCPSTQTTPAIGAGIPACAVETFVGFGCFSGLIRSLMASVAASKELLKMFYCVHLIAVSVEVPPCAGLVSNL